MTLAEYTYAHTKRGACKCGRCSDGPANPDAHQPTAHTVNLSFFKVAIVGEPTRQDFMDKVETEAPICFDGREHSYIEIGAVVGDQGLALCLMGLGNLLNIWNLMTPHSMLGRFGFDEKTLMTYAGQGMVTIQTRKENAR